MIGGFNGIYKLDRLYKRWTSNREDQPLALVGYSDSTNVVIDTRQLYSIEEVLETDIDINRPNDLGICFMFVGDDMMEFRNDCIEVFNINS